MPIRTYEVREDDNGSVTCQIQGSNPNIDFGRVIRTFEASTFEEASTKHHQLMGWEPYRPMGEAADCPRECGSIYYPEGSGECPNCGSIG